VHEEAAVAVPAYLSDEEAASLCGAGVTAWQALYVLTQLCPGQHVLVQGTGSVSLFALQLARLGGAEVSVLSRSAEKLTRARALGAHHAIDTTAVPGWESAVLALTGGRGVDVVIDVLGGEQLNRSIAAVRVGGSVIAARFLDGMSSQLDLPSAIRRSVTLRTTSGRSRENFEAFMRALEIGRLQPVIDRVFAFAQADRAFDYLGRGSAFGKVVVRVSD
jgi:NADPH:quinone reductase-like Zn-dependent oxidoreductase